MTPEQKTLLFFIMCSPAVWFISSFIIEKIDKSDWGFFKAPFGGLSILIAFWGFYLLYFYVG